MKKTIVFAIAAVMAITASVSSSANGSTHDGNLNHHKSTHIEATSHGSGSCRHGGCKCSSFTRLEGGAGKCTCGHWDYVHN